MNSSNNNWPFPDNWPGPEYKLVVENEYTRDEVIEKFDDAGNTIEWKMRPTPPPGEGWFAFDLSSDKRTGWRRFRLEERKPNRG